MKNTLESKAAFFAQYWGQKIMTMTVNDNNFLQTVGFTYMNRYKVENCHLELKPLSMISDQDAFKVGNIFGWLESEGDSISDIIQNGHRIVSNILDNKFSTSNLVLKLYLQVYDYLRSKGYALPYMDVSVETMIEYVWIKLKIE